MLRSMLDKVEPLFHKGGPLEKLYPLYEANDTFLYTPGEVANGKTHVRDAIDTKRMMTMVIVALIPCILMASTTRDSKHKRSSLLERPKFHLVSRLRKDSGAAIGVTQSWKPSTST